MRHLLINIMLCLLSVGTATAQKVKPVNYGGQVNLMEAKGKVGSRTLVLRTSGYGKSEGIAKDDAEVRAIRAALYVGFGKNLPKIVSMSEAEAESQSNGKLEAFFDNKEYKDCITDVKVKGKLDKLKGEKVKSQLYEVSVNYDALKLKMSEIGVNKFGF